MKRKITLIIIILFTVATKAQSYFPLRNVETNLESFSGVNGQWIATSPVNNTLGANYYQGINFGFDINNYSSLVNGVGTNDLYFGRWSGGWKGWNKIWHSGNLNNTDTDFTAKTINITAGLDIKNSYNINTTKALKMFYQGSWGTAQYASDYRFIDIESTEGGKILALNGYGMGIGFNPPSYSSQDKLYINGNVGIGTESIGSQTKLHVKESGSSDNVWRGRIVASGDLNAIVMGEYGGKAWLGAHNSQLNAWSNLIIQGGGGNVGIGMTNPLNKLDVNGTIHSKEVKIDMTGWSDFVFKKEYELPTLAEVEKHIAEKGHLENIPSEEEVLKNGINLGEMNAKLLQKIEELTLYSINQNKKIETQAKEIESLKDLVLRVTKIESELARK